MMPFSPLRTWGLGLLGWAIVAGGIYCLWEWADGTHLAIVERREVRDPASGQVVREEQRVIATADNHGGWPYLLGGLALLTVSFGGSWPVSLFLGRSGSGEPLSDRPGQRQPSASATLEASLPQGIAAAVQGGHLGFWERHSDVNALIDEFAAKFTTPAGSSRPEVGVNNAAPA